MVHPWQTEALEKHGPNATLEDAFAVGERRIAELENQRNGLITSAIAAKERIAELEAKLARVAKARDWKMALADELKERVETAEAIVDTEAQWILDRAGVLAPLYARTALLERENGELRMVADNRLREIEEAIAASPSNRGTTSIIGLVQYLERENGRTKAILAGKQDVIDELQGR